MNTTMYQPPPYMPMEVFKRLPEGISAQLIENLIVMEPPPVYIHQDISAALGNSIYNFVKRRGLGKVLFAPVGVYLRKEDRKMLIDHERDIMVTEPASLRPGQDLRWQQRLNNYKRALSQLQKFIDKGDLNELEEQGLIQSFEYTYELAWNVIKDYYTLQGVEGIQGSKDAIRLAFNRGLIKDGEGWMRMLESRIKSTHTYEEETAREIAEAIFSNYYHLFGTFLQTMENLSYHAA